MSWRETVLAEYGRSLGFNTLAFNANGVANLRFERRGELFLERTDTGLLAYVVRPLSHPDAALFRQVLAACHWDHNPDYPLNAALEGGQNLVFSIALPEADLDVPTLTLALESLDRLHHFVEEGVDR